MHKELIAEWLANSIQLSPVTSLRWKKECQTNNIPAKESFASFNAYKNLSLYGLR